MTRSISAKLPTSSVIAVEGVSGEMATPAFMLLSWMALMSEIASAGRDPGFKLWDIQRKMMFYRYAHTSLLCGNSTVYHPRLRLRRPTEEGGGGINGSEWAGVFWNVAPVLV